MAELQIQEVERAQLPKPHAVLALEGEVDPHTVGELKARLKRLADDDVTTLILDLKRTAYVNSSALAVLVKFAQTLRERGGGIALTHVNARVRMPFEMLGLLRFFTVYDTVKDAKGSLSSDV